MTQANFTGTVLEQFIQERLNTAGYAYVPRKDFFPACYIEQPIYSRHVHVGKSIYETPIYCDYILYHPVKWPNKLIIESKWQQVGGSVDEKYPYLILNIQAKYPSKTILLLDGKGYKPGAERWLRGQSGNGNLLQVYNMMEFQAWANKGHL